MTKMETSIIRLECKIDEAIIDLMHGGNEKISGDLM